MNFGRVCLLKACTLLVSIRRKEGCMAGNRRLAGWQQRRHKIALQLTKASSEILRTLPPRFRSKFTASAVGRMKLIGCFAT